MYLIKYTHMAHIKRINYREIIHLLYNKEKHQGPMEKASRKGRFTLISRGCVVFEQLFSGFSCFFWREKKALQELQQRKTSKKELPSMKLEARFQQSRGYPKSCHKEAESANKQPKWRKNSKKHQIPKKYPKINDQNNISRLKYYRRAVVFVSD